MLLNKEITNSQIYKDNLPDTNIKKIIGEGTFGKVYLIENTISNKLYALKIITKTYLTEDDEIKTKRELEIISSINHPNIIKVYKTFESKEAFFIVMDYIKTGDLYDYISKKKKLSNEESSIIFYQIFSTIEFLHKKKICHRDIKPENILILKNLEIKLIDFGLCNYIKNNNLLSTPCGSINYASPESFICNKYDGEKFDIWSLGILLFVMLSGFLPYEGKNIFKVYNQIIEKKLEFPNFFNKNAKELICKMLEINPFKRICINDIKKEKFYKFSQRVFNVKLRKKKIQLNGNFSVDKKKKSNIYSNEIYSTISSSIKSNYRNNKLISLINSPNLSTRKENDKKVFKVIKKKKLKLNDINNNLIESCKIINFRNKNRNISEEKKNIFELNTVNINNIKMDNYSNNKKSVENFVFNNYTNRNYIKKFKFSSQNSSVNDSIINSIDYKMKNKNTTEIKSIKKISLPMTPKEKKYLNNKSKNLGNSIFNNITPIKVNHNKNNSNIEFEKIKKNQTKQKYISEIKDQMKWSIFYKSKY